MLAWTSMSDGDVMPGITIPNRRNTSGPLTSDALQSPTTQQQPADLFSFTSSSSALNSAMPPPPLSTSANLSSNPPHRASKSILQQHPLSVNTTALPTLDLGWSASSPLSPLQVSQPGTPQLLAAPIPSSAQIQLMSPPAARQQLPTSPINTIPAQTLMDQMWASAVMVGGGGARGADLASTYNNTGNRTSSMAVALAEQQGTSPSTVPSPSMSEGPLTPPPYIRTANAADLVLGDTFSMQDLLQPLSASAPASLCFPPSQSLQVQRHLETRLSTQSTSDSAVVSMKLDAHEEFFPTTPLDLFMPDPTPSQAPSSLHSPTSPPTFGFPLTLDTSAGALSVSSRLGSPPQQSPLVHHSNTTSGFPSIITNVNAAGMGSGGG
ncbi:hypothetical protein HK102_007546, partial [Quaeritorhiza haematococci]